MIRSLGILAFLPSSLRKRQSRRGNVSKIVGAFPPFSIDRTKSGNLDTDVLNGGIIRRSNDHLESSECRLKLTHLTPEAITGLPVVRSRGESVVRTLQFGEAPCTFNDIAGQDVAQHRRLAGARRPVDPHQATTCTS